MKNRVSYTPAAFLALLFFASCSDTSPPPATSDAADAAAPDARPADLARDQSSSLPDQDAAHDVIAPSLDTASPPLITFPRDESPHSDPIEWWYYTGVLKTGGGATYGFELVTFQAVLQPFVGYMAHYAVTDLPRSGFHLATGSSLFDQRGAQSGFDLAVGEWKMSGHDGHDQISAAMPGYAMDLSLSAQKPVVFQYGTGWMTVGSANPFYYYSYTRMGVTGTLTVDGAPQPVTGQAWMDHQWGDPGTNYQGWDWYSLRLDDQTEVMLFVVRKAGQAGFAGGTFVDPTGQATELKSGDFTVTAMGRWTSPHTGAIYPQGWTTSVPALGLTATITPVMADQEFTESILGSPVYWEGLCTVAATRKGASVSGQAYVELTNYTP
jgi:predicted secreted hydrolase